MRKKPYQNCSLREQDVRRARLSKVLSFVQQVILSVDSVAVSYGFASIEGGAGICSGPKVGSTVNFG